MTLPEKLLAEAHKNVVSIAARAEEIDTRIRQLVEGAKSDFIECGVLLNEVDDNALWSHLTNPDTGDPYQNFSEWATSVLSYGRSTYMEAKRVVKEFSHIPIDDLREIQRVNFKHLRLLPESKQTDGMIEAAKGPEKDFIAKVKGDLPELHVEHKQRLIFGLYESSLRVVDDAIVTKLKALQRDDPTATKEDALEQICQEWLENQ